MSTYVLIKDIEEWITLRSKYVAIYKDEGNDCPTKEIWRDTPIQLNHLIIIIDNIKKEIYYRKKIIHTQVTNWAQMIENLKTGRVMYILTSKDKYRRSNNVDLINFNLWTKEDE